jgi:hypothetical protein
LLTHPQRYGHFAWPKGALGVRTTRIAGVGPITVPDT